MFLDDAGIDAATPVDGGDHDSGTLDANPADAGLRDAGPEPSDSGRPGVTIEVRVDAVPAADAFVVFHDSAGDVLETQLTDDSGIAFLPLDSGVAMATVVWTFVAYRDMITYTDLHPGDYVVAETVDADTYLRPITVTIAEPTAPAEAVSFVVRTVCGIGTLDDRTSSMVMLDACGREGLFDVLAYALDSGGEVVAYSFALNRPSGATDIIMPSFATDLVRVPTAITNSMAGIGVGESASLFGGRALGAIELGSSSADDIPIPPTMFDSFQQTYFRVAIRPDGRETMFVTRTTLARPTTITFDAAADPLSEVVISLAEQTTDPARPRVEWVSAVGGEGDYADVRIGGWTVRVPPSTSRLVWPALPPLLADSRPLLGADVTVRVLDLSYVDGWEAVRLGGDPTGTVPPYTERSRSSRRALATP